MERQGHCVRFKLVDLAINLSKVMADGQYSDILDGLLGWLPLDLDADAFPVPGLVKVLGWDGVDSRDKHVTLDSVPGAPNIMISSHVYQTGTGLRDRTSTKVVGIWYMETLVLVTPLDWRLSTTKKVWPFLCSQQEHAPSTLCRLIMSLASLSDVWQSMIAGCDEQ
jgi:hypothetical protein